MLNPPQADEASQRLSGGKVEILYFAAGIGGTTTG